MTLCLLKGLSTLNDKDKETSNLLPACNLHKHLREGASGGVHEHHDLALLCNLVPFPFNINKNYLRVPLTAVNSHRRVFSIMIKRASVEARDFLSLEACYSFQVDFLLGPVSKGDLNLQFLCPVQFHLAWLCFYQWLAWIG